MNWEDDHVLHLIGENATREAILSSIDWLITRADSNDIVFFSVACHGFTQPDSRGIVSFQDERISLEELNEKFNSIDAKGLCLLFDCCHSGEFVRRSPKKVHTLEGENRVVLMSTWNRGLGVAGWIAYENETMKSISLRNTFGEAFLNQIDYNNDTFCSAEEAFQYAQDIIHPYALRTFFDLAYQIPILLLTHFIIIPFPTIYDNYEGEFPLVKL